MIPYLFLASAAPEVAARFDPRLALFVGLLLVLLNGFFVAAEFALVKVRPTQLDPIVQRGDRRAQARPAHAAAPRRLPFGDPARHHPGQPGPGLDRRAGLRLDHRAGRRRASPGTIRALSSIRSAVTIAFLVITLLHIVLGELAPEVDRHPQGRAHVPVGGAAALRLLQAHLPGDLAAQPRGERPAARWSGSRRPSEGEIAHSEEELRLLLSTSHDGPSCPAQSASCSTTSSSSHRVARQIMVPRADVVYLSTTQRSLEENLRLARRSGHTRFPLCDGDLDHVVGLIHIKDLFRAERPPTSAARGGARDRLRARDARRSTACSSACAPSASTWPRCSTSTAASPASSRWRTSSRRSSARSRTSSTSRSPSWSQRGDGVYQVSGGDAGRGPRGRARHRAQRPRRGHHRRRGALRARPAAARRRPGRLGAVVVRGARGRAQPGQGAQRDDRSGRRGAKQLGG